MYIVNCPFNKMKILSEASIGLEKRFPMMYSNIGLNSRETVPLSQFRTSHGSERFVEGLSPWLLKVFWNGWTINHSPYSTPPKSLKSTWVKNDSASPREVKELFSDAGDQIWKPVRHGPQDAVQLRHLRGQRDLQPAGLPGLVQGKALNTKEDGSS